MYYDLLIPLMLPPTLGHGRCSTDAPPSIKQAATSSQRAAVEAALAPRGAADVALVAVAPAVSASLVPPGAIRAPPVPPGTCTEWRLVSGASVAEGVVAGPVVVTCAWLPVPLASAPGTSVAPP